MELEAEGKVGGQGLGQLPSVRMTRGVQGGQACIRETRHTIAGLVQWQRLGLADQQILARHPDLTQRDLDAAWAYYDRHREETDLIIREDEEA